MHYQILPPNELDLSFPTPNYCAKFCQIPFKIATNRKSEDRQTDASNLIICPMLCYSNGADNYLKSSKNTQRHSIWRNI